MSTSLRSKARPYNVSAPQVSSVQATIPGSERVLAVVLAGQSDSCRRQIAPALGQDFAVFEALNAAITRAPSDVDALAQTNPRFEQAIDEWRQCFRQAGFEANDPLAALDTFHASGPRPSAGERLAAQADAQCKESADLLGSWNQAVRSAEIVVGEDIRPELGYWLEMRVSILSNAVSILESA
jgi:hypothetical protein